MQFGYGITQCEKYAAMRESSPTLNRQKTREIILYILEKMPEISDRTLKEILYFIDFDYYERYEEHLMGFTWKKKK